MEALVITLREGIEAALVVGIILAYLKKTGQLALNRYVYTGLGLAVLASLGVALLFQAIGFDPENEYLEGAMLGIGGLFVASMVLWMWRAAKNMGREMGERLDRLVVQMKTGATLGARLGLFFFTFFMVFREGVETVIFLWATAAGEAANLLDFLGGALGLGLAALFAVLFIRGSLRINLHRFFSVTSVVLLILAAKLLAASLHEFAEVKLIPMTKEAMAVLGYFVRDASSTVIVMALIAAPILVLLWESLRKKTLSPLAPQSSSERRKLIAAARLERAWQLGLGAATALIVLALATTTTFARNKLLDPTPQPVNAFGEEVLIPLTGLEGERLHKFVHTIEGVEVRFLLAKLKDGSVVSGLDACQICGPKGYGQEGKLAICKNCNAPIPMDSFAFGGGCNPLALEAKVRTEQVAVTHADLLAAKGVFRR